MNITDTLRDRLKKYMKEQSRSIRYIADKMGIVTYQTIHNFLKDKHQPTGRLINRLDAFLKSEGY